VQTTPERARQGWSPFSWVQIYCNARWPCYRAERPFSLALCARLWGRAISGDASSRPWGADSEISRSSAFEPAKRCQSVGDLGDGRYELAVYLLNTGGDDPIYVMSRDIHAYVQVGSIWQEVPLRPADSSFGDVLRIDGKQIYRYLFDARVRDFTQRCQNYMHVRFSGSILVSRSEKPKDDVFERRDNYYVYPPTEITCQPW
jgi:hypothetical protein